MNVKKFVAATSREALRMIRIELGAEAVILSNRKVDSGVEIMALASSEFAQFTHDSIPPNPVPVRTALVAQERTPTAIMAEPATSHLPSMQQEQQDILSEIKLMRNMMQEQIECQSWSDRQQRDPQRTRILRDLLNAGFSASLSRQMIEKMPATANMEWVRQVLENNLRIATQQEDIIVRGGVVALIGPTGVGKTTTTAKLAARAVVRYGADKVALLTTDSYRIGAHEQLRIYGKILGITVHAVRDTEDLRLTLSSLKQKHLVLIDTIGMGQRDNRVAAQAEMFNATGVQRLLLLNATSSGDTLNDVVCMYNGAGVIGCIPTKLDEAVTFGTVLDVAMRYKLTLHYIANGQRVPEDLHEVNMDYLLHRALKPTAKEAPFTLHELEFPAFMAGVGAAPVMREDHAS